MRLHPILTAVGTTLVLVAIAACGSETETATGAEDGSATVVTALYPLAFVAERVGGEEVIVTNLASPGVEPHDVELSPRQVGEVADASLVIYFDGFAPAVDEAAEQNAADRLFDVSTVVDLVPAAADDHADEEGEDHAEEESEDHADDEGDDHADHGDVDPHFWLDPTKVAELAHAFAERLAELDPDHAADFRARANALATELDELDASYAERLADCETTTLVTSHDAFGYLATRYGLDQVGVAGLEPDAEPSAARIAEVQEIIRETNSSTIFFEPLSSSDIADSIAADLEVESESLSPLESQPEEGDYLTAMRENLEALETGLRCS